MQDRSSAGAIATLAFLLFLLQGLTNGVANGNMAAMALASDGVICSTHMPDGATGKQDPSGKLANTCCGTLCRLAATAAAVVIDAPSELIAPIIQIADIGLIVVYAKPAPPPPNHESRPRAPPLRLQS